MRLVKNNFETNFQILISLMNIEQDKYLELAVVLGKRDKSRRKSKIHKVVQDLLLIKKEKSLK